MKKILVSSSHDNLFIIKRIYVSIIFTTTNHLKITQSLFHYEWNILISGLGMLLFIDLRVSSLINDTTCLKIPFYLRNSIQHTKWQLSKINEYHVNISLYSYVYILGYVDSSRLCLININRKKRFLSSCELNSTSIISQWEQHVVWHLHTTMNKHHNSINSKNYVFFYSEWFSFWVNA